MLRSNLSTRPFYNVRAVRVLLTACLGVVLVLSALHLVWARSLAVRERTLTARATESEAEATRLRADAQRMRATINPDELKAMTAAAREVNAVVEQRAFSWGSLLVQLEGSLPPDVRVTSIQPTLEEDGIVVAMHLESRSDEQLSVFMNELERRGMFTDIWPVERQWGDKLLDAVVKGTFVPDRAPVEGGALPVETSARRGGKGAR